MAEHGQGYVWPDAAGTPTDPTEAFAIDGPDVSIQHTTRLVMVVTVAGSDCDAVEVMVSTTAAGAAVAIGQVPMAIASIPGAAVGDHIVVIDLPESSVSSISLRRLGGNVNSTVVAYAYSRRADLTLGRGGQPPELMMAQTEGVILWDDGAGAADATGGAYALGPAGVGHWLAVGRATEVVLLATLSGGPSTTIELQVEESMLAPIPIVSSVQDVVSSVTAGVDRRYPAEIQLNGSNGTHSATIQTRPGTYLRVWAKDTGASSDLIVRGIPYLVEG